MFWERCVDHICSRQGVSVSLSLSLAPFLTCVSDDGSVAFEFVRLLAWMSISFFFLNGGFLQSGTPKSFNFIFHYEPSNYWGTPIYGQPPNTDLPRNGFLSQGDHSGLHILDVEKHAWSEQTFTGTPPEKVGCTGGTLGCWIPQRRCQKISHPAWLIWDLG